MTFRIMIRPGTLFKLIITYIHAYIHTSCALLIKCLTVENSGQKSIEDGRN
jgi:hypothetical protein